MAGRLTAEQIEDYWRDGYVCVRALFAAQDLAPWLQRTRDLARGTAAPPPAMQLVRDVMVAKKAFVPPTPEHAICKINFFENDATFMSYARHPALLDCVESL